MGDHKYALSTDIQLCAWPQYTHTHPHMHTHMCTHTHTLHTYNVPTIPCCINSIYLQNWANKIMLVACKLLYLHSNVLVLVYLFHVQFYLQNSSAQHPLPRGVVLLLSYVSLTIALSPNLTPDLRADPAPEIT